MAGRDNVIFYATIASGTVAGTVTPLTLLYGVENVRQGYGTAKLKNIRAVYGGGYSNDLVSMEIDVKNSNWIDSAGLSAVKINAATALSRNSLSFMRGRDKELQPNTSWIITAKTVSNTTAAATVYVILEIEYSDVAGINTELASGSPVMKTATASSVTGSANTLINLGSFDNLLQGTEYVLSEVASSGVSDNNVTFLIVEGFSNQKGLIRAIPLRHFGTAEQIEGSVKLTKQTYNLGLITSASLSSATVGIRLEMIANKN